MPAKHQAMRWCRPAAKAQAPGDAADDVLALQGAAGPAKRNHLSWSLTVQPDGTNLPAGLGKPGKWSRSSTFDLSVDPLTDEVAIPWSVKFIPTFQGDSGEEWETWISQLEAVSDCHGWNENQKAGVILSALRDTAAKFVYKAINKRDRKDYAVLVSELGSRFGSLETERTFRVWWANISQQPGQTEQELAAEIWRIHAEAYPDRDAETRWVDLVDKFPDSLRDESQRSAIEFNKCPIWSRRLLSIPSSIKKLHGLHMLVELYMTPRMTKMTLSFVQLDQSIERTGKRAVNNWYPEKKIARYWNTEACSNNWDPASP